MPDPKQVIVTFTPPSQGSWSFDPQKVTMNGAGKITLVRSASSPAWKFESATNLPGGCVGNPKKDGAEMDIDDDGTKTNGFVSYSVTVSFNGTNYTSPMTTPAAEVGIPPMIMNE